ncbi:sigma-70 family RNA polymerase sigma factor [Streptomyces soliscabiei]|uniref:sigma-70 family RNA polymerase sigma factor n=1 Tax=Streptomyces soliscabiei TaxID=588897 RepID=UPI0029BC54CF|nr:sigma-70 family RNA polymerase sigma factor [Streptomyces sp. NY05-11A]MDX2683698.1 sigma-70 family RNA polymerase sigma factor [Streptomyces sp. NY05-11A]
MTEQEFDAEVAALVGLHGPSLVKRLMATGTQRSDAEAMVNTAFLTVRKKWPVLRDENPLAYARKVLTNLCIKQAKKTKRDHSFGIGLGVDPDETPTGPDSFEAVIDRIVIKDALTQVSPRQRQAVVLRHVEQLTVKETAERMGVTEGSVKSHTSDGLHALQKILADSYRRPGKEGM